MSGKKKANHFKRSLCNFMAIALVCLFSACTPESNFVQLPVDNPPPLATSTVPFEAYFDGGQSYHIYNRYQIHPSGSVKTINMVEPLAQILKKDKFEQADITIKGLETLLLHLRVFSYGKALVPLDPRLTVRTDATTLPGLTPSAVIVGNGNSFNLNAAIKVTLPTFEYSSKNLGEGNLNVNIKFDEGGGKIHQKDLKLHIAMHELNVPPVCTDGGGPQVKQFIRGDVDGNRRLGAADALAILGHLFLGIPMVCLEAASVNGGYAKENAGMTDIDISDAVYLLNYLFLSGPPLEGPPRLKTDGTVSEFYEGRDPEDIEVYDPNVHKNSCCSGTL